jgi:hypothetical protein
MYDMRAANSRPRDSVQGRERVKLRVARFAVHSIGLLARLAPAHELKRVLDPKPRRFRIQFAGVSPDRGPSILREVEIEVVDVSAAIIAAANIAWPPRTIGLRILDSQAVRYLADGRSIADSRHRDDTRSLRHDRQQRARPFAHARAIPPVLPNCGSPRKWTGPARRHHARARPERTRGSI